ncbi:MAG: hypothetical protein ACYDBP_00720 [Leptospirales bacterium]
MKDEEFGPSSRNPGDPGVDTYVPGVCNIDRKGRWIRGGGAFLGLVFVVIYNEKWRLVLTYPAPYATGMVLLATGTALSLIQAMASFCVVDGLLGRTFIPGERLSAAVESPESRKKDRTRSFILIGGAFVAGFLFSAVLLISEINASR